MFFFLSIFELFILYFFSRLITKSLSHLIHRKTRKVHLTVKIFSFLLLPGTFLHELAHYVVAHMLGVRTFDFVLLPKLEAQHVRLGSVTIAKTDIIRRTLIGIAPLLLGVTIIFVCIWWVLLAASHPLWLLLLLGVIIFQISNTMFPSKADISKMVAFFIVFLFLLVTLLLWLSNWAGTAYALGSLSYFQTAVSYFTIIIGIDIVALLLLQILLRIR